MVGQVHSEFKRQFLEMTVDKLLEQFVLSKYTGLEKPGKRSIESFKLNIDGFEQNQMVELNIAFFHAEKNKQQSAYHFRIHKFFQFVNALGFFTPIKKKCNQIQQNS